MCVFCYSFVCSISLLLSDFLSCILNNVLYIYYDCSCIIGEAGYGIYKYMPYGPVELVIPYLIRRAYENQGMLVGANKERQLVKKEIFKRLFQTPFS